MMLLVHAWLLLTGGLLTVLGIVVGAQAVLGWARRRPPTARLTLRSARS